MNQTTTQFTSWINTATPDDLVLIGKTLSKRMVDLPVQYRKEFVANLPPRIFEGTPQFGKTHDSVNA